ncbi:MAG: hypothetical protein ACFFD2_22645 [Promethearchaeota archaeon]
MSDDIERRRLSKKKRKAEKRRMERDLIEKQRKQNFRIELFMKIAIFSVLAFIPVEFFMKFYPIITNTALSFELTSIAFILLEALGILFGIGLYFAGKKMKRDTGIYSGAFQIDGSILGLVGISVYLIVNPLRYTQGDVIVNSLYYGLETVSSITLLIFSLLIAFFFILVGTNVEKQSLKYITMIIGLLWLVNLFIPAFTPAPSSDLTLYSIITGFAWAIYILTAYGLWKMLTDEGMQPSPTAPYRIK